MQSWDRTHPRYLSSTWSLQPTWPNEPEPPQELAPPTAFTASVFEVDKLEDQEVTDIVQVIDTAAFEAEPTLDKATQTGASTYDLTVTLVPAPPPGTGAPAAKSGTYGMDLGPTEDCSSPEEESPVADPLGPVAAVVIAVAAAERARASVISAPAGDITEGRKDVDRMQSHHYGTGTHRKEFS